ncbi:MAG: hypothetical protein ACI4QI_06680 [Candidatus Coproplasma sp.]
MKKLITSIVLSTALVGGACMATGCAPSNSTSTGDEVATVEDLNSATSFYTYGAASIGSVISATETPAEGEEGTTEGEEGVTEGEEGTTETPAEGEEGTTETPAEGEEGTTEGEEGTTETPAEDEEGTTETPAEGEEGTTEDEEGTTETPAGSEEETPAGSEEETPADGEGEIPADGEQPAGGLTDEQLATVNSYMGLVENLLANGGLSYIRTESDREGYETKEVISFSDLEGNVITYVMYYNSDLEYVETDFHHDKEETETRYTIEGIMIIDGVEYALEGYSEVETDGDESESETYFKVTLADGSYIIMEQEAENDETELVYKVVSDKKVVEKIKFETEIEDGKTEIKMTVEKDGVETSLKFSEESENGVTYIKVTAKGGESDVSFKIEVTQDEEGNNVYQYIFGDKIKEMYRHHFEKGDWGDGKWGDREWNHGQWNQGEHGNGKWEWHVEDIINNLPAEQAPAEDQLPEQLPVEEIEQPIKDYFNNQNNQNKH